MPKITRKQQKVFAVNAQNNGVFGSLQANDPVHSQDPDVIQSRTAYSNGWNDATYSAEKLPPLEEFQALQYLFSRQLAYLMQEGIAEWDTNTTYYKGALVKAIQSDGSFILYASLVDNNQGNLVTDTTKWVITNTSTNFHNGIPNWRDDVIYSKGDWVKEDSGNSYAIFESIVDNNLDNPTTDTSKWLIRPFNSGLPLFTPMWFDAEVEMTNFLNANSFSWNDGSVYISAYEHLVDDIDGKSSSVETIGSYTITYYQADDGHKIVLADQEATVLNIYNESGVAWYYILDTTNTRFKLPRENPAREELIQVVRAKGNGITLGLTDGTNNYGFSCSQNNSSSVLYDGGYGTNVGSNVSGNLSRVSMGITTDSTKSGIISDMTESTSVYKGKKYLYFYVGNDVRNETQIDVGEITNTLSNKLDADRIQFVEYLPQDPISNVLYLIEE